MSNGLTINHENLSIPSIYCKIVLDENKRPTDCILIDANSAFEDLIGLKKEKFLKKTFLETHDFLSEKISEFIDKLGKVALAGESAELKFFSVFIDKWFNVVAINHDYMYFTLLFNVKINNDNLENELKRVNYINSLLLDSIPHPALLVRKDRTVIAANKIAKEQGTIVGGFCWRDWGHSLYINEEDASRANSYIPGKSEIIRCSFCKGCKSLEIEETTNVKTKLGNLFWDIFWVPTREKGVYLHYAIDITKEKQREMEIEYLSYHDKLTGLYNRAYFEKRLDELEKNTELPVSIIMGDINGLKLANDVFGHREGDSLLQRTSEILKKACRQADIVARYGGDEFAIILPNTPHTIALQVCDKINKFCNNSRREYIPTSISLGCATMNQVDEDIYKVLKIAEDRMYRHKLLESKSIRNSILSSLETSLHEKDIETKEHATRLVLTTAKIGERLGLMRNKMDELNLLARLHDIGKITVDERILNKESKLTDEEYEEIKKHSESGYRIAETSQDLRKISEYILTHHERWDGKGYPYGLKGEEIPLLSRILSIADAYDAMTNDRPYRKAMSKKEAIQELKDYGGKQFDPKLVPIFIEIIEED